MKKIYQKDFKDYASDQEMLEHQLSKISKLDIELGDKKIELYTVERNFLLECLVITAILLWAIIFVLLILTTA